ncbi:MAG: hypothetical protein IJR08_02025 [Bacilli bacterium]|nr:hypothetical protein [Bacilli bacterium]
MKKALIAIISTIYVVALVIVAFLGTRAEVINRVVFVEDIVLNNTSIYKRNAEQIPANRIVAVYKRPDASQIDENGRDKVETRINWDFEGTKRDYAIFIDDYYYYYELISTRYTIDVSVIPEDATNKELSFYLQATDTLKEQIKMTSYGEIDLTNLKHKSGYVDVDIVISSTDHSEVSKDILLKINKYE